MSNTTVAITSSTSPASVGLGVRQIIVNRPHSPATIAAPPTLPAPETEEIPQRMPSALRVATEGAADLHCLSRLVHAVAQHATSASEADGWAVVALGRERLYVWSDAGSGSLSIPENTLSEAATVLSTEDRPLPSSYHFCSLREYQQCRAVAALFPSMELAERGACDVAASLILWAGYVTGVVILFSKSSRLSVHAASFAENAAAMLRGIVASAFHQPST